MISISDFLIIVLTFVYVVTTIFIGFFNYKLMKITSHQISLIKSQMQITSSNFDEQIRVSNIPLLEISFNYIKKEHLKEHVSEFLINEEETNNIFVMWQFNLLMKNIGIGLAYNSSVSFEVLETNDRFSSRIDQNFMKVGDSIERAFIFKAPSLYQNCELTESNLHETKWKKSFGVRVFFKYQDVIGNTYQRNMLIKLISYPFSYSDDLGIQIRTKVELGELSHFNLIEKTIAK